MTTNGSYPEIDDGIPSGTDPKEETRILEVLGDLGRHFSTLKDVALSGVGGEPLDDKTYLMEKIIELTADLPHKSHTSQTLTNKFLNELWTDLDHPPNSYLGYDFAFRKADGSNNNILWPHIGQAGQPYARSVRPQKMQPPRPDPGVIFESVLKRPAGTFEAHPNNISSVLFYLASIIIHDCFHTSHSDYAISETSSYLDLSPLYGSSDEQQKSVRTMIDGKLKPDCFADNRIHGFPPGVGVMLIMFNRFHNHVVENIAKIDEGGRFSAILDPHKRRRTGLTAPDKPGEEKTPEQYYDEALFQHGRLITCGLYINIVLGDYVRTILGLNRVDTLWNLDPRAAYSKGFGAQKIPQAQGNQVSAEFSLVYRWHSCVSERDTKWTDELMKKVMEKKIDGRPDATVIEKAAVWADDIAKLAPNDRPFENLKRQDDGSFSDDELCKIWADSVEDVAGAFGAAHVPENLKFVEVLSMMQARRWNLASLNEFREYFKLQPHKTFESINPDPKIAKQLERLYGHPDNVEIYPGIVVESAKKPMNPGSGLCASWTTSRAILADAVALVRSDRFYTVDYTPNNLTNWGFHAASSDLNINHGGVFYKLVLNAFPNHVKKNSVYAHFPLVNPGANEKTILPKLKRAQLYDYKRPEGKLAPIEMKASTGTAVKVMTDPAKSSWLWTSASAIFGAPAPPKVTSAKKIVFAEAVLANEKWKTIATKFYSTKLEQLWKEKQYQLGEHQAIDLVADVLNAAHTSFITSVLGIPLPSENGSRSHGLLANMGHVAEHAFGTNHHPHGLGDDVRSVTRWVVGAITAAFDGNAKSKEGELGKAAFDKLIEVNGRDAKEQAWHDILPTAALILTTLSKHTALAAEHVVDKKTKAVEATEMMVAVRATTNIGNAQKGQIVVVNFRNNNSAGGFEKWGPEVELAYKISEVASQAIENVVSKVKGIERMPGPQGIIKRINMNDGSTRYMNETESEYLACPVSMKVRWKQ